MFDKILQIIAPHYCCGCGSVGIILCSNCKHNIVLESSDTCILCQLPARNGICATCKLRTSYSRAWFVGRRDGVLQAVIDDYKFERKRAIHSTLADLLDSQVPVLPKDTIVVSITTASPHIRQRGYDHCHLVAKKFAQLRGLTYRPATLYRTHNKTQRGKSKRERKQQARQAFAIGEKIATNRPYVIIDDIMTTGATLQAAANLLHLAGVKDVSIAVVARQTLDD